MTKRNETILWKILLPLTAALITLGGLSFTINHNYSTNEKQEVKIEQHGKDIESLNTHVIYIREGIDEIKKNTKK